ncbi:hypothetical protein BDS110ZK4_62020 [Bradyrhizobium diazoefficiens]|uniref:Uncharacterized protein n=1 Tax=Bradyrhizobium diazoefficiens TaxID=1355477 RepID=A0A809ZBG7_9BRAD|nr:hypothetical protein XF1B_41730 [Bradyrhizobium diazoefficiens]BCE47738.1 hypothetical protein XF4B_40870 [Bradyrhizobium diazoefficiens]BCE65294.1 hypothetical protein XF6B_40930 [Bradyrhizobium diazoefficiens]
MLELRLDRPDGAELARIAAAARSLWAGCTVTIEQHPSFTLVCISPVPEDFTDTDVILVFGVAPWWRE